MEKSQEQDRQQILDLVADYCRKYHLENKKPYEPGRQNSLCIPGI